MQSLKTKISKFVIVPVIVLFALIVVMPAPLAMAKERPECKGATSGAQITECIQTSPLMKTLKTIVDFLSAGVGIVVTGSIIVGGVQYALAGNNPSAVSAAKKRISDSLIALFAFLFIFAFLQWILPGGLIF